MAESDNNKKIAELAKAREIMHELAKTNGISMEGVAASWHNASISLSRADIWVDGADELAKGSFDYQKQAGKVIKEIDALARVLKNNNSKEAERLSGKLSHEMHEGIKYTAGYQR